MPTDSATERPFPAANRPARPACSSPSTAASTTRGSRRRHRRHGCWMSRLARRPTRSGDSGTTRQRRRLRARLRAGTGRLRLRLRPQRRRCIVRPAVLRLHRGVAGWRPLRRLALPCAWMRVRAWGGAASGMRGQSGKSAQSAQRRDASRTAAGMRRRQRTGVTVCERARADAPSPSVWLHQPLIEACTDLIGPLEWRQRQSKESAASQTVEGRCRWRWRW